MVNNNKAVVFLIVTFTLSIIIHIIPAYVSNNLFSTDVWPLYRDAKILLEKPDAKIWDDKFFDGYNNHWPGTIFSTTIYTWITGIPLRIVYMYSYTIILSLGLFLLFYIVIRRLYSINASILAIFILGYTPSYLVFTSSPLKETYAYPLFFAITYFALRTLIDKVLEGRDLLVISILSIGLVLSHHLATFMLAGFLFGFVFVSLAYYLWGKNLVSPLYMFKAFLIVLVIVGVFLLYYFAYGSTGLKIPSSPNNILIYILYGLVLYGGYLVFMDKRSNRLFIPILASLSTILFLMFFPNIARVLPGVSILGSRLFWYVLPMVLSIPFIIVVGDDMVNLLLNGMGLFILYNIIYVLFGAPFFSSIIHRFINYIVFIMAIIVAYMWQKRSLLKKSLALFMVLATLLSGIIVVFNIVSYRDGVSYTWYYPISETRGFDTVFAYASDDLEIVGDTKIAYYGIMVKNIDSRPLLKTLYYKENPDNNQLFIIYYENYRVGYMVYLNYYSIDSVFDRGSYNRLYDNYYVQAYLYGGIY